jgi:hypothetical protein
MTGSDLIDINALAHRCLANGMTLIKGDLRRICSVLGNRATDDLVMVAARLLASDDPSRTKVRRNVLHDHRFYRHAIERSLALPETDRIPGLAGEAVIAFANAFSVKSGGADLEPAEYDEIFARVRRRAASVQEQKAVEIEQRRLAQMERAEARNAKKRARDELQTHLDRHAAHVKATGVLLAWFPASINDIIQRPSLMTAAAGPSESFVEALLTIDVGKLRSAMTDAGVGSVEHLHRWIDIAPAALVHVDRLLAQFYSTSPHESRRLALSRFGVDGDAIAQAYEEAVRRANETADREREERRQREVVAREEARRLKAWISTLLDRPTAAAAMGLKIADFDHHVEAHRIPVARVELFQKWGKLLSKNLFDPTVLPGLMERIPDWEREDAENEGRERLRKAAEKAIKRERGRQAKLITRRLKHWTKAAVPRIGVEGKVWILDVSYPGPYGVTIPLTVTSDVPARFLAAAMADAPRGKERAALIDMIRTAIDDLTLTVDRAVADVFERVRRDCDERTAQYPVSMVSAVLRRALESAKATLPDRMTVGAISSRFQSRLLSVCQYEIARIEKRFAAIERQKAMNLHDIPSLYSLARAMDRRILVFIGPTNSGKTHAAMERLTAAALGTYLAPLRLMAMEGQERLSFAGRACDLVTGEEEIRVEGATLVSSTIECCDLQTLRDVAVVDEGQLIGDADRGWAWTQAILGVPAKEVIVVGSADLLPAVEKIAAMTGEPVEVRHFERKTPLEVVPSVTLHDVKPGDALIAFSRKDVLAYREALVQRGHSVAVIYGALSPEVRRRESERFRSGGADVLVATDAIGMGLNLPIRRIIFTVDRKFDGQTVRTLLHSEIRQIGGRAGRYGIMDAGEVTALQRVSMSLIRDAIKTGPVIDGPVLFLPFLPPFDAIRLVSESQNTTDLGRILRHIEETLHVGNAEFRLASLDDALRIWDMIKRYKLPLETAYRYLACPIDLKEDVACQYLVESAKIHARGEPVAALPKVGRGVPTNNTDLQVRERDARILVAYLWMTRHWPEIYTEREEAERRRNNLNEEIALCLAKKALSRLCRECGITLSASNRHAICDPCYRSRRASDDWDF